MLLSSLFITLTDGAPLTYVFILVFICTESPRVAVSLHLVSFAVKKQLFCVVVNLFFELISFHLKVWLQIWVFYLKWAMKQSRVRDLKRSVWIDFFHATFHWSLLEAHLFRYCAGSNHSLIWPFLPFWLPHIWMSVSLQECVQQENMFPSEFFLGCYRTLCSGAFALSQTEWKSNPSSDVPTERWCTEISLPCSRGKDNFTNANVNIWT